jgi:hypothetical protein
MKRGAALIALPLAIAACGGGSTNSSSHTTTHHPSVAAEVNRVKALGLCLEVRAGTQSLLTDWKPVQSAINAGDMQPDTTALQHDVTQLGNNVTALRDLATNATDQAHLAADTAALGQLEVGFQDMASGDMTDALTSIQAGSAGIAGFGTNTIHICR